MSVFGSEEVITEHISEADLRAYFVGFDFGKYRLDDLLNILMDVLVDFVFGFHEGIKQTYTRKILKEAAQSLYKIEVFKQSKKTYLENNGEYEDDIQEKYLKRGEFGELILHLILRDFINTVPLVSKIYFKDSDGITVHGFDAIHIGPNLRKSDCSSIYLGESKLYKDGKKGVEALLNDIEEHFTKDFLKREFMLIGKKKNAFLKLEEYIDLNTKDQYEEFLRQKEYWFDELDRVANQNGKLQDLFSSVTIPLLCTYTSEVFSNHTNDENEEFIREYEREIRYLKEIFYNKFKELQKKYKNSGEPIHSDLNVIVMLFPVPNKSELVKELHRKLSKIQGI